MIYRWIYSSLLFLLWVVQVDAQIGFQEVSDSYEVYHNLGQTTIGGGVSIYDFNQDGLEDLTLATYKGYPLGFYQNTGDGFIRMPPLVNNLETVKQINWVDYDNDGDPDLYVAANDGINRLYKNIGDLTFEDVTESSGLAMDHHLGYGACWGDYNRDGWLDLYYASKGIIGFPDSVRSYNRLFKNNGDGNFIERTEEAKVSDEGKLPFCAAFIDYNNDMWPDIYIANDKLTFNTLFENNGRGVYTDVSVATGANAKMNAMCVNPGDYNMDGWMDIYITNTPVGSQYLENSGIEDEAGYIQLENVAAEVGVDFKGGNCWGSNFLDADNDGDLDLYVSSSIGTTKDVSSAFFENINGAYFESPIIEGLQEDVSESYTNAVGDLNDDGLVDIVVQNNPSKDFFIWENTSNYNHHWLKVKLEGVLSNRDGVGSRIEAYAGDSYQMQYSLCGSGFLGQNSSFKQIGLGEHDMMDSLIITWPSGHVDRLYDLVADQKMLVLEGQTTNGEISVAEDVRIVDRRVSTPTDDINILPITIYPNPGGATLSIATDLDISQMDIIDIYGKLIRSESIIRSNRTFSADDLLVGVYFIKIWSRDDSFQLLKWVKSI